MDDLAREVAGLRLRLRLHMMAVVGVIVVGLFAFGGADVVARALVESDAWKVRTKKADLSTVVDRLVVTTDVDNARIKVLNANVELAQQATLPTTGVNPGTIAYDSTAKALKYYNGTAWVASGGGTGGGGIGSMPGGRLSGDQGTLLYSKYVSDYIEINGEIVQISTSSNSLGPTWPLIDGTGLLTTSSMVVGTTYHIYMSNSQATAAPRSLKGSTVDGQGGYLGTTGQAANWRQVGIVRLNTAGQFEDSDQRRYVFNYFNKIPQRLYAKPGYVDDNLATTWSTTTGWNWLGSQPSCRLEWLGHWDTSVELHFETSVVKAGGGDVWVAIMANPQIPQALTLSQASAYVNVSLTHFATSVYSDHTNWRDLMVKVTAGSATFAIDSARTGTQLSDPPITTFWGIIWD